MTVENIKKSLINYYPSGDAWVAKSNQESNLNKRIGATAVEFNRQLETITTVKQELNLLKTEQLISNFEKEYGIPDDCFSTSVSLEQRINQVNIKQLMNGADEASDWEYIASLLGFDVTVLNGIDSSVPPYDVPFIPLSTAMARFTIFVFGDDIVGEFPPYDVPFTPEKSNSSGVLFCIFLKLKPTDNQLIFVDTVTNSFLIS